MKIAKIQLGISDLAEISKKAPVLQNEISFTILQNLGKHKYLILLQNNRVSVTSRETLFPGEKIQAKMINKSGSREFSITERIFQFQSDAAATIKNENSLPTGILKSLIRNKDSVDTDAALKILQTYFPEIDWKPETSYFHWQLKNGEAEGFSGKKRDLNVVSLFFSLKNSGNSSFSLSWRKEDLGDLKISGRFEKQQTYETSLMHKNLFEKLFQHFNIYLSAFELGFVSDRRNKEWKI